MSEGERAGFPAKAAVLGVLALAGVGFAGWKSYEFFKPVKEGRTRMMRDRADVAPGDPAPLASNERRVTREAGEGPAIFIPSPQGEYAFEKVKDADELAAQAESLTRSIEAASDEAGLADLGSFGREQLAQDVTSVLAPLLADSEDGFFDAVAALGGDRPPEDRPMIRQIFAQYADQLGYASIDTSKVTVRPVPTGSAAGEDWQYAQAGMMVVNQMNRRGEDGTETTTTLLRNWPRGLFPGLDDFVAKGRRAVQVLAPVRVKGSTSEQPDMHLGVIMVWDPQAKRWQPVAYDLYLHNQDLREGFMPRQRG